MSEPTEKPDYMSHEDLLSLISTTVEQQLGSLEAKVNAILDSVMPPTSDSQPNSQATSSATGECSSTGVGTPNGIWFLSRAHTLHNKSYL